MEGNIYKITNDINGKVYIGQTVQSVEKRFKQHMFKNSCPKLANAIKKYGKSHFTIETLETIESTSKADLQGKLDSREIY